MQLPQFLRSDRNCELFSSLCRTPYLDGALQATGVLLNQRNTHSSEESEVSAHSKLFYFTRLSTRSIRSSTATESLIHYISTSTTLHRMSRTTPVSAKKRKLEEAMRGKTGKPRKRIRKQKKYHSSSEDEAESDRDVGFVPVNLGDSDEETQVIEPAAGRKVKTGPRQTAADTPQPAQAKPAKKQKGRAQQDENDSDEKAASSSEEEEQGQSGIETEDAKAQADTKKDSVSASHKELNEGENDDEDEDDEASDPGSELEGGSGSESESGTASTIKRKPKSKRNDPEAFSTSISKILSTKLPTSQRSDPVLSRSAEAAKSRTEATNARLDKKAVARLRAEKQAARQKGRTTDVLGIERGIAGEVAEKEKQLRKIATRGVIQLFNAFRGAHERAEEARREERKKGTVGMGERERKVGEVSKEGFLELIGGKKKGSEAS